MCYMTKSSPVFIYWTEYIYNFDCIFSLYLLWNVTKSAITLLNLFFCIKWIFLLPRPWIIYFMVSLLNTSWFWIDFLGLLEVSGVLVSKKKKKLFFSLLEAFSFVCRCFSGTVGSYCSQDPLPISKYGRHGFSQMKNSNKIGKNCRKR